MMIVFNEDNLEDIEPPCVAQTLINHDGYLHKIFVIGDRHHIVQRPSLKNLRAGGIDTHITPISDSLLPLYL